MKEKTAETVGLMMRVVRMHRCSCERRLEQFGLHHSQHRMLMYLYRQGEPLSQKQLAEQFGISAAAVSGTVRKLQESGHVSVSNCEKDRRQYNVEITPMGREVAELSREIFSGIDSAMLDGITDEQTEILRQCLNKMKENLERSTQ